MIPLHRLAFVAAVALCGCGGAKDATVAAPLSAASAPASGAGPAPVVVAPPVAPVTAPIKVAALSLPALTPTAIGALTPLAARASDSAGAAVTGAALTWSSADPTIATVDAAGFVTPIRAGFTTITVSADGVPHPGRSRCAARPGFRRDRNTSASTSRESPITRLSSRLPI